MSNVMDCGRTIAFPESVLGRLLTNCSWLLIPNYMTRQIIVINIIHHIKVILNTFKVQVNQDNMHCIML